MGGCLVVGSGCGSASPEPSASQMTWSSEGTYELDGHRLVLTSSAATVVRTALALLAGTEDAPTSVSIGTGRFSEPEPE